MSYHKNRSLRERSTWNNRHLRNDILRDVTYVEKWQPTKSLYVRPLRGIIAALYVDKKYISSTSIFVT